LEMGATANQKELARRMTGIAGAAHGSINAWAALLRSWTTDT
jgi:hypothetical protein